MDLPIGNANTKFMIKYLEPVKTTNKKYYLDIKLTDKIHYRVIYDKIKGLIETMIFKDKSIYKTNIDKDILNEAIRRIKNDK